MSTRGYNKCVWVGNLTADPELRATGTGAPLLIFRISVTRTYSSNGLTQDDTRYFRTIRWGKTAEVAHSYLVKANRVLVEGRLENQQYTDPATRQEHRFGEPSSRLPGDEPLPDAVVPG